MNIQKQFDQSMKEMAHCVRSFPWDNADAYAQWLRDSYEYVNNSTRILALAGGTMPHHHTQYSNRFIQHASEEKNHEKLLAHDLKSLGKDVHSMKASHEMKVFHQTLYYWLSNHSTPLGLFGWILSLEGLAVTQGPWIYKHTENAHGKKACTFLRLHSDEDPDHLEKAFKSVESLNEVDSMLVCEATEQYSKQYCQVLNSIKNNLKTKAIAA